jgi:hypothetical protein
MTTLTMETMAIKTATTKKVGSKENISKNDVIYFPFETEKETVDWMEDVVSQWWDDETI